MEQGISAAQVMVGGAILRLRSGQARAATCFHHRYASVFILDRLPLELDGARIADEDYTVLLDQALVRDYRALGYDVVRVPVLSPTERLQFVLGRLSELGLI